MPDINDDNYVLPLNYDLNDIIRKFGVVTLNSTEPVAPGDATNITWQTDEFGNISAYTSGGGGGGAVDSVNGQTGEVVLDANDVGATQSNFGSYTAFGDSITFGSHISSPLGAYPYYVGQYLGLPTNNQGVPGATSQSTDAVIFANTVPSTPVKPLISYQIGTNNVTAGSGAGPLKAYQDNILAQYTYLALPNSSKIFGTNPSITYAGTWTTGVFTVGKRTTTVNSTATLSLTGSTLFLGFAASNSNTATATITVDGVPSGVTPILVETQGNQTTLSAITGLTDTAHTVVVTLTGAGTLELDWAAGFSGVVDSTYPILFAGEIPDRNPIDAVTPLYTAEQQTVMAQLQGYGFTNIHFVTTSGLLTPVTDYFDTLHPNDLGQYLLAASGYIPAVATLIGSPLAAPLFEGGPLSNSGKFNAGNLGIGGDTFLALTTAASCTAIGQTALTALTSGIRNTAIGASSGNTVTASTQQTYVGVSSGQVGNTTFTESGSFGYTALINASGAYQIGAGTNATANTLQFKGWNFLTSTGVGSFFAVKNSATQSTITGATSGNMVCSQPEQGTSYKRVVIYCNALNGAATYTFPTAFVNTPQVLSQLLAAIVTTVSNTAVTITGLPSTGFIELSGY